MFETLALWETTQSLLEVLISLSGEAQHVQQCRTFSLDSGYLLSTSSGAYTHKLPKNTAVLCCHSLVSNFFFFEIYVAILYAIEAANLNWF